MSWSASTSPNVRKAGRAEGHKLIIQTQIHGVVYGLAETTDIEEMAELLANVFSRSDPPAVAASLSFHDVYEVVIQYGRRAPGDALTLLARIQPSGKLVGAMLSDDFASPPPVSEEKLAQNFRPIAALLEGLDEQYRKSHPVVPGQILHLFMLAVASDFGGKGIARTLVHLTLENGKHRGFARAITEATGNVSQHIFRKNGFIERCRIAYQEFMYEGKRPFESIVEHEAVILLERDLNVGES